MSRPGEGLVLMATVAALGAICDYDVPSFVSPNLRGPLGSAWQLGEMHLGPVERMSIAPRCKSIQLT